MVGVISLRPALNEPLVFNIFTISKMKINIDLDELKMVLQHGTEDVNYYLDSTTGKILAEIDEPFYVDGTPAEREIIEDFLSEDFIENPRYIDIPVTEQLKSFSEITEENYRDMQTFVNVIHDRSLKQKLQKIIDLNCSSDFALQKFLEIMKRRPERKQWLSFREKQEEERDKYILDIIDKLIISKKRDNNIEYDI